MVPTDVPQAENLNPQAFTDGGSTLAIPKWFIAIVLLLLSARVYVKLTQMSAPPGQGVAWMSVDDFDKLSEAQKKAKGLVLYEFTASWCPPCQKRERTEFRSRKIIDEINNNFVAVRVDVTTEAQAKKENVRLLNDKFNVYSIPRCVVTLPSGEFVCDDHYLFGKEFLEFLTDSEKSANTVRAELDLAKGDNAAALAKLDPEWLKGKSLYDRGFELSDFVMTQHLLAVLNRSSEAETMMDQTLAKTKASKKDVPGADVEESQIVKILESMNDFLRGKATEDKMLSVATYDSYKGSCYLAVGLKNLREGHKESALKALHQAALFNAKSYQSDRLAEYITKQME